MIGLDSPGADAPGSLLVLRRGAGALRGDGAMIGLHGTGALRCGAGAIAGLQVPRAAALGRKADGHRAQEPGR